MKQYSLSLLALTAIVISCVATDIQFEKISLSDAQKKAVKEIR